MELENIRKTKDKIKGYVNDVDPWHLIEMGAPEDEYNSQIDRIVSLVVNKKPDKVGLESALYTIFKTNEFELEQNKIKKLAQKIKKAMESRNNDGK